MDNADKANERAEREPKARADDRDDSSRKTPNTDMQAEDVTTEDSAKGDKREDRPAGDARATAGGTPAEDAMKQTSKTDAEAGG
ncbi:hypothetical protein [Ramlibacter tataouinensis]|uniref:Uncharacterized protein n=1 Tax=Ramlibacter tataouinensis (strain ATCC BAA-407 / DSM 14655 / LMG 21543 / TTB310) TaxID=365046 RepID=F5Y2M4_RAMTT|nr:hypothetical protein [Ramlibacter tataouinensis]AEG92387.1 hypothetical protein Rta_13000 [Ramlibacter tataouinensis TTB310]